MTDSVAYQQATNSASVVPPQLLNDYQQWFSSTKPGDSTQFAGGTLVRNATGAMWTDPNAPLGSDQQQMSLGPNSNLSDVASHISKIGDAWKQQYGWTPGGATSGATTGASSTTAAGTRPTGTTSIANETSQFNPSSYGGSGGNSLFGLGGGAGGTGAQPYSQPNWNSFAGQNGIPDYMGLASAQSAYNQNNARQQSSLNNPNYYGPQGSQVRTMNPDGTYSVTQSLDPQLQSNYDASNRLQGNLLSRMQSAAGNGLNYNGVPGAPTLNTSGVSAIPNADANDLAQMRDSVYNQQKQYLDPQFQQGQSDLESKLTNQGIMPGSEAYNREMGNFNLTKQKAYGDARNSAIQAGGQEQSRLFGLGLQSNQAGMNNAVTGFNAGMQGRQQGVSEANTVHNSQINDLNALRTGSQVSLPNFQSQVGTSIPGVDFMNAANLGYNANLAQRNANTAQSTNFTNGLFGLGSAALQGGVFNNAGNWFGGNGGYNNWLGNNSGAMNSAGLSPSDLSFAG